MSVSKYKGTAVFSPCERYRYTLTRELPIQLEIPAEMAVTFVMLNPSTANATDDDPTIRRCIGYAIAWGFCHLRIGNAYALRSTNPDALWTVDDPVGPDNDHHIANLCADADLVVCAWGANIKPGRAARVLDVIRGVGQVPHALKLTQAGIPNHPLYLAKTLKPFALPEET